MTKNKRTFDEWLALPRGLREPKTQKELALRLNIQLETLSRWKGDPALQDLVNQVTRAHLETELPEINHVVVEKAKEGDIKFVKLVPKMTGRHTDAVTIMSEVTQVGIEKYTAVISQVAEWEKERFGN